jgi:small subunit ribosomal protein S6
MEHNRNSYETTVIINAALEDNQVESVITRIQETITKNNGEVSAINRWGRKRLAYQIKKKNNGYFVNVEFTAFGEIVRPLESYYSLDEQIIRFLTIKLDKKALKAKELGPIPLPEPIEVVPEIPDVPVAPILKEPLFDTETPA